VSTVARLSSLLAHTGLLRHLPPAGPLIVMYHGLGGSDGVRPEDFGRHLDLLAARRRIVPLAEAVGALGTEAAHRLAAVTFDDGYRDFARHALPVLRLRGLHATLFVPAAHVGGANVWDQGRAPRREILDAAELRDLDPDVVGIGAHGATHRRLAGLGAAALREETVEARRRLEAVTGRPVRLFAYPYGQLDDFDAAAERAVREAGFLAACSTHFGRGSRTKDRFRLCRVGIETQDSLDGVARKLDGAQDWMRWKERAGSAWRRTLRMAGLRRQSARVK
jgi:peptidoglycan/xylan/chitin deacetylase (PgdA/CDA1 family)